MFKKIEVLVVDDSAFMRKVISDMVNSEVDMETIDTARDGEKAVEKAKLLRPDVITLDVEMPKKNGLEALIDIKKYTSCQVIMLSSLTSKESKITIEALKEGAFDFIQKPSGSISLDIEKVKKELIEKIRYAYHYKKFNKSNDEIKPEIKKDVHIQTEPVKKAIIHEEIKHTHSNHLEKIQAVLIGASTGGPRVVNSIIKKLPGNLGIPVFVVQHMPKGFTAAFAERIDSESTLHVVEAKDGEEIKKDTVYIAPGGFHMTISNSRIMLDVSPPLHGVRPCVDKLFISASQVYRSGIVACILTGMGHDGADGIKTVKANGGYVLSQNESSCTVYGMPKAAYETGCVDEVLPDSKFAERITEIVRRTV